MVEQYAYKITDASTTPKTGILLDEIWFSYSIDKLFKRVSLQTTYMSKNIASKDGRDLIDNFAMADDDRDVFDINIRTITAEVCDTILKMTHGIDNAVSTENALTAFSLEISNEITIQIPAREKSLLIKIQDNDNYNSNTKNLVDLSIEECLVNGICREWYQFVAHSDFMNLFNARYVEAQEKLKQRFFQLKKKNALS